MLANWIARQAQQHGSLDGNPAALVFYVPKVRSGTRGQEGRIFPLRPSTFPILQQSIERGLGLFGGVCSALSSSFLQRNGTCGKIG